MTFAIKFLISATFLWQFITGKSCYYQAANYTASNDFFSYFQFETFDDPTHGYVDYVDYSTAKNYGLVEYRNNQVYIGVDHTNVVQWGERGRKSVRLNSNIVINGNNLVVIDLAHMPSTSGVTGMPQGCSVWPAFWTCGSNWPNNGEIDLIEYVNTDSVAATTLHTSDGCDQSSESTSSFSGYWSNTNGNPNDNCYVYAPGQYSNTGCSIISGKSSSVGSSFNNNGVNGGVYALEWDNTSQIRAWYFTRDSIPWDLASGQPNPDSWGTPYARFEIGSSCSASHFANHNIIFDTTFCGDWAGAVFGQTCGYSQTCESFVQYNPQEFTEAYWLLNYVSVYNSC